MAGSPRFAARRLPESLRSRLDVATALAWEALVDTHVAQALAFVQLLQHSLPIEESLPRYLMEMDLGDSMSSAIRTRVLVSADIPTAGEDPEPTRLRPGDDSVEPPDAGETGWRRFKPIVVVRGMRERQKRDDEIEGRIKLALARAEEAAIATHVDNAITFAALLKEILPLDRAVQEYVYEVGLSGGRAQSVHQRTMARLAEVNLPIPAKPAD